MFIIVHFFCGVWPMVGSLGELNFIYHFYHCSQFVPDFNIVTHDNRPFILIFISIFFQCRSISEVANYSAEHLLFLRCSHNILCRHYFLNFMFHTDITTESLFIRRPQMYSKSTRLQYLPYYRKSIILILIVRFSFNGLRI